MDASEHQTLFRRPRGLARARLWVTRTGAGRRPQKLYKQKARDWRRRNRVLLLSVSLIPLAFLALSYVFFAPRSASFLMGFGCGATTAIYIGLRELGVPDRIDNWRVGAEGERRTGRQLRRLERTGWLVRHSVMADHGDRDHIAVGPCGIFLLDSKTRRGRISVQAGGLVIDYPDEDRPRRPEAMARVIKARARDLAESVRAEVVSTGDVSYTPFVKAIVVIWGDFPQASVESEGVRFVHGERLASWLESEAVSVPIPDWLERSVIDAVVRIAAGVSEGRADEMPPAVSGLTSTAA